MCPRIRPEGSGRCAQRAGASARAGQPLGAAASAGHHAGAAFSAGHHVGTSARWVQSFLQRLVFAPVVTAGVLAAPTLATLGFAATAEPAPKVLRLAIHSETGFDPARVGDARSFLILSHIFDPLLGYDPLARPVKLRPRKALAMPQATPDFRTWTVKLRPGIFFTDHPSFGGQPRELVAADYVFSLTRIADPATKSPAWSALEQSGITGLAARRREALDHKRAFDYSRSIEGLQALDRYTLRFTLDAGRPRFAQQLADAATGAVAREVIAAHGEASMQHPVGTGPFRLSQWRRASRIVLERNPGYREVLYDAEPAADDAQGQALLARLKGRRLPMLDRVELAVIDEAQPTWLAFLNRETDLVDLPDAFADVALPGGRIVPHLAKRGIRAERVG